MGSPRFSFDTPFLRNPLEVIISDVVEANFGIATNQGADFRVHTLLNRVCSCSRKLRNMLTLFTKNDERAPLIFKYRLVINAISNAACA